MRVQTPETAGYYLEKADCGGRWRNAYQSKKPEREASDRGKSVKIKIKNLLIRGDASPMSRFLTITNSNSLGIGQRKRVVKPQSLRIGNVTINFILATLVCLLGVFYIFEVNNIATKGYEIKSFENRLEDLRKENERLKIQAAESKSMYNIEEKTKELNMVVPKDISYLSLPGNVAMK
jgi:hypothetical protein